MDIIFWSALPNPYGLIQRYLGPYQLGFWLKEHGYSYQVIDFIVSGPEKRRTVAELVEQTEKFITPDTKVIGISSTFFYIPGRRKNINFPDNMLDAMEIIKEKHPHIKFILGGNKAETYGTEITSLFNGIVVGLAEDVLLELMEFYSGKGPEPMSRRLLPHKAKFYYSDDVIDKKYNIQTGRHQWSVNDCILPGETLPLEVSRGCIFKCKFCQYPLLGRSKYDYARSPECLREELVDNYEKWRTTNYYILDDTFNDTVQKMKDFYEMTKTLPFKIKYATYLRADLLHRFPETIPWLKESGLVGAHFGIETFHPEASKGIGKAWSGTKAKEFLPWLIHEAWNDEVAIHISMIAGLPGEEEDSLIESAQWLTDNEIPSWNFKPLGITKGDERIFTSEYAKDAELYGFTWPDPTLPYAWVNTKTGWDWERTRRAAKAANRVRKLKKYDSWSIMSLLTVGYKLEDVLRVPKNYFNKKVLIRKRNLFLHAYRKKLRDLPNNGAVYITMDLMHNENPDLFLEVPTEEDEDEGEAL
jgi:hypothetical protein